MGAFLWTTGPAHIYISKPTGAGGGSPGSGAGGKGSAQYLGTCERSPIIEIMPEYTSAFSDSTGRRVPYDEIWAGEHAIIRADLTRYDESVYYGVAGKAGKSDGEIGEIGAMMLLEGFMFAVQIVFPNSASDPVNTNLNIRGGYQFPACTLVNPERLDELGTMARKLGVVFHAIPEAKKGNLYFAVRPQVPDPK